MKLPAEILTFLFTDIEGSTRLWEEHPDAMRLALVRHDALMRTAIEQHGGTVFKTIGDAFCAVFHTAPDALHAALAMQQGLHREAWPESMTIKVRMALHTGVAEARDNDYFGRSLNRVARLLAIGHGGQVLVSLVTQELIRDTLPPNASLPSLGEHRLRDLTRSETVYQLVHPDLPAQFPPLKSLNSSQWPNNLPQQMTSFIGREKEIAEVSTLLEKNRLLTLTGSGGCGKTRLSLQVAADALEQYPDGVWLVELASLTDSALVAQTIAQTLGIKEQTGESLQQTLLDSLKAKRLLLVLDNCEHLIAACAHLVSALLRSCANVKVLASSREPLSIAGEQRFRVPSLSVPDPRQTLRVETLTQFEAVRLFIERSTLVKSDFAVDSHNIGALAHVCSRLDGIPLAIELAAARVRSLSVLEINTRLDNRFRLLTGGDRTALPRQQTLRALIDWSYDLLSAQERLLLARLSVFVGGWALDAAEQVCTEEGREEETGYGREEGRVGNLHFPVSSSLFPDEVLDVLTSLVDKSLVIANDQDGSVRYRMLETVRQYTVEKLQASGDREPRRGAHRDYFLTLAEEAQRNLQGQGQAIWLQRLEVEHDNLREALTWCATEATGTEAGLRLAGALWWFWKVHGHLSEGRQKLSEALDRAGDEVSAVVRANALDGAGALAWRQGDYLAATTQLEAALTIYRKIEDPLGEAMCLAHLGLVAMEQGDSQAARTRYEAALTIYREAESHKGEVSCLTNLGILDCMQGDYTQAKTRFEAALKISREIGNQVEEAQCLGNLGVLAGYEGDSQTARLRYEETLPIFRKIGDRWAEARCQANLGTISFNQGDYTQAKTQFASALKIMREIDHKLGTAGVLEGLASLITKRSQPQCAARLYGAAEFLREMIGAPQNPGEKQGYDRQVSEARIAAGEMVFDTAWASGRTLSIDEAIAEALKAIESQN